MVDTKKKLLIWLLWLALVPLGMFFIYIYFPPQHPLFSLEALSFLILTIFVSSIPLIINNTPIFFIQWVSLVVFLVFGLFVEMIFMQIAIVVLFITIRLPREQFFRIPLNWLIFFVISITSGSIYYLLGGTHGPDIVKDPYSIFVVLVYSITYFFLNQIILNIVANILYKERRKLIDIDFNWEALTTLLSLPLSYILFILYWELGIISIIVVGIPFVSISVIIKLYYMSDKINQDLQNAAEIGHELAVRMPQKEVLDVYVKRLTELVPSDYVYVFEVDGVELHLRKKFEKYPGKSNEIRTLKMNEGIGGYVWAKKKASLFHSKKDWEHIERGYLPNDVESIIAVPIIRSKRVTAVVLIASKTKRAYEKTQLMIIDILSSYFAVAMENAKYYEQTVADNERCPLTKVYNFRYFQRRMAEENQLLSAGERKHLSAIMLDIDHFKSVNDAYGHESGNEILCEFADRLLQLIGDSGTVIRFGGEEFVILLPEVEKTGALRIAEIVRQRIAHDPFTLRHHFHQGMKDISLKITASIGVASVPEDAEEVMALIRHADRALYVGAKRNGRNKVAGYVK